MNEITPEFPEPHQTTGEHKNTVKDPVKPGRPHKPVRRFFRKWLAIMVVLAVIVFGVWSWIATSFPYATEEATGYVQSFKKQGWLCKTWEGQMVVSGIPGSVPSILSFTVKNDSLATELQAAMQDRLTITVDQHRGVPASCFGETQSYLKSFRTTPF